MMRHIHEIIVHCAATQPNWASDKSTEWKAQEIRRWHLARGWRDIGYHFIIDRDGTIAKGRPVDQEGAHTLGHNTGTIGICLMGGHGSAATDHPTEHFSISQLVELRALIDGLKREHPTIREVSGHNEYAAKACPGFRVKDWYHVQPIADHVPTKPPAPWWTGIIEAITEFLKWKS